MKQQSKLMNGLITLTGVMVGIGTVYFIKENRPIKAKSVLKSTKEYYQTLGEVNGSWIDYHPVNYPLIESEPLVYQGGVSIKVKDSVIHYHFICDAYNGNILDSYPVKQDKLKNYQSK